MTQDIERLRRTLRRSTRRANECCDELKVYALPPVPIQPHIGPRPTPETAFGLKSPSTQVQKHRTVINKNGTFKIFDGGLR